MFSLESKRIFKICFCLTNKEASTVLCSVVKHAGSGRARKKCSGKHETQSSAFPHFLSALPLPKFSKILTILLLRLLLSFCFDREDISRTRDSVSSGYPNTENFVKNTPLRVVFSTLFSVFGYPDETLSLVFDILLLVLPIFHFCFY